nr:MAG TPA: hypothetical protein [Crassvirales sp.]
MFSYFCHYVTIFYFINILSSCEIIMWQISGLILLSSLDFQEVTIILNITTIILQKSFHSFLSKIHIWFIFCKIISFSYYFIMERFRFSFISY